MSIDWSKAPEGATHYHITEDINPWRKIEGTVAYEHYRGKWLRVNSFNEGYMPDYYVPIPRETWDGQGLPPVGIEAEAIWDGADIAYFRAKILAHDEGRVVFRWCEGKRKGQYESYAVLKFGSLPAFRPLRTPEQIAAEERAKAIEEMCFTVETLTVKQAKALFDAGYRRQEEGK
ncbi:TPA: hypothetical protein NKO46_003544 [Pseudomonas aeruginosa]|nr:hypothetical protein [Pseudomonas aeruginosa]